MKKKGKTAKTKAGAGATTNYRAIYLSLNGNNWGVNNTYLVTCIHEANEYNIPLYVNGNAGNPPQPPPCPPGNPNCGNP
jgi:hypothetical protein